ncbi:phospholipase D-like domain-containing protein, partial [Klebsiella variicola]|uniref:phospholipase D-like domain-containing protein n=4 Tax=Enterobacteriaceae TaxID=543 RepID=UPI0038D150C2
QNDVTLKMPAFEWVHVQLHQQKGMISLSPPTICNSAPLRTDSDFPIQHDKVIIVDNVTVETGSFNFTKAAETKNSENAVVIWNMPKLAESFLEHWQDRWNRGRDYRSSY